MLETAMVFLRHETWWVTLRGTLCGIWHAIAKRGCRCFFLHLLFLHVTVVFTCYLYCIFDSHVKCICAMISCAGCLPGLMVMWLSVALATTFWLPSKGSVAPSIGTRQSAVELEVINLVDTVLFTPLSKSQTCL